MIRVTIKLFAYDADVSCHVEGCLYSHTMKGKHSEQFTAALEKLAVDHMKHYHNTVLLKHEIYVEDNRPGQGVGGRRRT